MEFDVQALQVVDFDIVGARISSFTEYEPRPERSVRRPLPNPIPSVEAAPGASVPSWATLAALNEAMPPAITANWSRLAKADLDQSAFLKIVRMANRLDGWRGARSQSLRPAVLRHFLEFWMRVRHASALPQFALLPNGHLQALWSSTDRRRMDLEYTESNRVYFGVLNGRRLHEGVERADVMATLLLAHPSRPLTWRPQPDGKNQTPGYSEV